MKKYLAIILISIMIIGIFSSYATSIRADSSSTYQKEYLDFKEIYANFTENFLSNSWWHSKGDEFAKDAYEYLIGSVKPSYTDILARLADYIIPGVDSATAIVGFTTATIQSLTHSTEAMRCYTIEECLISGYVEKNIIVKEKLNELKENSEQIIDALNENNETLVHSLFYERLAVLELLYRQMPVYLDEIWFFIKNHPLLFPFSDINFNLYSTLRSTIELLRVTLISDYYITSAGFMGTKTSAQLNLVCADWSLVIRESPYRESDAQFKSYQFDTFDHSQDYTEYEIILSPEDFSIGQTLQVKLYSSTAPNLYAYLQWGSSSENHLQLDPSESYIYTSIEAAPGTYHLLVKPLSNAGSYILETYLTEEGSNKPVSITHTKHSTKASIPNILSPVIITPSSKSISLGEFFDVEIHSTNNGEMAEWQSIAVSFPDLTNANNLQILANTTDSAKIYPVGFHANSKYGSETVALSYPLVEGSSEEWGNLEDKSIKLRVYPEKTGEFNICIKSVAWHAGMWFSSPEIGTTADSDQQSEYVYKERVTVSFSGLNPFQTLWRAPMHDGYWTSSFSAPGSLSLATGDVTGDGIPDVAAVPSDWEYNGGGTENTLEVFKNNGDKLWSATVTIDGGKVAISDIDSDGRGEVFAFGTTRDGPNSDAIVYAFDDNGALLWQYVDTLDYGSWAVTARWIAFTNIDTDSQMEIIVGNCGYLNKFTYALDTDGELLWRFIGNEVQYMLLGDITGDGKEEIIDLTNVGKSVYVINKDTGSLFWTTTTENYNSGVLGDLTGDGINDLVVSTGAADIYPPNNALSVFKSDGTQLWSKILTFGAESSPTVPVLEDINGDGIKDIVVGAEQKIEAYSNDGTPLWTWGTSTFFEGKTPQVYHFDTNGDSVNEIIFFKGKEVYELSKTGSVSIVGILPVSDLWKISEFDGKVTEEKSTQSTWLTSDDLNSDGYNELVCYEIINGVFYVTVITTNRDISQSIETCSELGSSKVVFNAGDTVFMKGTGFASTKTYSLFIVPHQIAWTNSMTPPARVPDTATSITTDASGGIAVTSIYPDAMPGQYDILIDLNGNGLFDSGVDVLLNDAVTIGGGFFVVPEYSYGALAALLACFISFGIFEISKNRPLKNGAPKQVYKLTET